MISWSDQRAIHWPSGLGAKLYSTMAEVWVVTTPLVDQYHLSLHRFALDGIEIVFENYRVHRLQATVRFSWVTAVNWAKRLGFVSEGEMPAFASDGTDYIRLVIVRKLNS